MSTEHQLLKMILTEEPEIWKSKEEEIYEFYYPGSQIVLRPVAYYNKHGRADYVELDWSLLTKEQFLKEVEG